MPFPGTDAAPEPPEVARRRTVSAHLSPVLGAWIRARELAVQGETDR